VVIVVRPTSLIAVTGGHVVNIYGTPGPCADGRDGYTLAP
jgi:hypothetical protein